MNVSQLFSRTQRLVAANSPVILTAIGVAGTVTTAYLSGKATLKASEVLRDAQIKENAHAPAGEVWSLSGKQQFHLVWQLYLPAVTTCTFTIAAIVCANRIGARRAAAIAAAYSISESAMLEYRDKVIERIGEGKERAIRDEIAQDRVKRNPPVEGQILITGTGDHLCMDAYSGRYFYSNIEAMRKAQNDINFQILNEDEARLTQFYNAIGLPSTSESDYVGWNTSKKLELSFSSALSNASSGYGENIPVLVVDFTTMPFPDPWRYV